MDKKIKGNAEFDRWWEQWVSALARIRRSGRKQRPQDLPAANLEPVADDWSTRETKRRLSLLSARDVSDVA